MAALRAAMDGNDLAAIHATLMRAVEGYCPELRHLARGQSSNGPVAVDLRRNGG
jgi:hypothetical protein